jgi:hypothetical protein
MHEIDREDFDRSFSRLCAGFDTPPTQPRKDAYWQGFRRHTITEFNRLVDAVLTESKFDSMPSVPALRKLLGERNAQPAYSGRQGPTVQEQLCEYVMLARFPVGRDGKFTPDQMGQTGRPWTYLFRQWRDETGRRCSDCSAVWVPPFGELEGFRVTVADMLGDPLHDRVLDRLGGQRAQLTGANP